LVETVKELEAFPELPVLVTVAVPAFAFNGTFVDRLKRPEALAVAEPSAVVTPASVNLLEMVLPAAKNSPTILNGAPP
jgi:hypothetical protein